MNMTKQLVQVALTVFVLSVTASAFATDVDTMMKKAEAAKGHADNIKKEGGEAKQNVKDLKAPETMKNASNAKDEGKKLKDVVTGK